MIFLAPLDITGVLGRRILLHEAPHDLFSVIEFVKTVPEEGCFLEVLNVSLSTL